MQPLKLPPVVQKPRGPILQIESLIFGLRRRGVPEEELERLREENKYVPPPPPPPKKTKKKKQAPTEELDAIFVPPPKKKVLKAVKKIIK